MIWGCAIRIASHIAVCIARFGPLSHSGTVDPPSPTSDFLAKNSYLEPGPKVEAEALTSEISRRLWLFPGSLGGFSRNSRGSPAKIAGKFPELQMLQMLRFRGTRKGKPAGNLGSKLPGPCPTFCAGSLKFSKSTVPAFSSFTQELVRQETTPAAIWRISLSFLREAGFLAKESDTLTDSE